MTREIRNKILEKYENKDDKIFVASILDLVHKFEMSGIVTHTSFLNLHEKSTAVSILNMLNINIEVFLPVSDIERTVIFLIPEHYNLEDIDKLYDSYITCLKITPPPKVTLMHKDYMGAIYNAGIKENMIGDIFINNNSGYVFILKQLESYYLNNLLYVSKNEVKTHTLPLTNSEVKELKVTYKDMELIIPSMRVDVILSNVFNLSRNEAKNKIENGDLVINAKEMYFASYEVKVNDIISFRKCGKIKIGEVIRKTKSANTVLSVQKYI